MGGRASTTCTSLNVWSTRSCITIWYDITPEGERESVCVCVCVREREREISIRNNNGVSLSNGVPHAYGGS